MEKTQAWAQCFRWGLNSAQGRLDRGNPVAEELAWILQSGHPREGGHAGDPGRSVQGGRMGAAAWRNLSSPREEQSSSR